MHPCLRNGGTRPPEFPNFKMCMVLPAPPPAVLNRNLLLLGAIAARSATTGLRGLFNLGVSGTRTCCPGWAEIGEFGFQTFDIQPQRGTARECQHDHAR